MAEQHSEDLWSVVLSGNRYFLGVIKEHNRERNTVKVQPCYEITAHLIPVRTPNGQQAMSKNISAEPVLLTFNESPMELSITGLLKGDEMHTGDQTRYKKLAASADKMSVESRAAESGLTTSGAMPPRA